MFVYFEVFIFYLLGLWEILTFFNMPKNTDED